MTIRNCIALVDEIAPNGVDASVKLRFLGEIEAKVKVELLGESPDSVEVFDENTYLDIELCVPHPFDQLYWLYLVAMLDFLGGDSARYENAAALFNAAYQNYGKWLKRRGV